MTADIPADVIEKAATALKQYGTNYKPEEIVWGVLRAAGWPELVAALRKLAEHCNNMESQHEDYHGIGDQPGPILSQPLSEAYDLLRRSSDV